MIQAFTIVLREGFESFLIVAITLSYLKKSGQQWLEGAVYGGVGMSLVVSGILGYTLKESANQSLWEGILGVVAIVMVGTLVIHMWRTGHRIKSDMEKKLSHYSSRPSPWAAPLGVFLFTVLMITREGMETAVMLIQIHDRRFLAGVGLGLLAALAMSYAWTRFSYRINLKRFFQVTGIFLLLFLVQVGIYSIHEFSEAGLLPNSEAIHIATERFSPVGFYGKWFSLGMVVVCAVWLAGAWMADSLHSPKNSLRKTFPLKA